VNAEPAVRPPAYQALADDLRAQITSGALRPGERLPAEPQLCVRSGLSRSTVREALRLLASQHLIVTTRGVTGGSFVACPSPAQLADTLSTGVRLMLTSATVDAMELIEIREMLEVPAAGLAAARRTDDDIVALEAALFDPRVDSVTRMLAAQREFHVVLGAATRNPLYELLTRPLHQVANGPELAAPLPRTFWARLDAEHRELMRRVADGDAAGAIAAAQRHMDTLRATHLARVPEEIALSRPGGPGRVAG
jgi:GntR family transcriptional regulator, transcriptional repressor for pyruvate dehydrogenase complex